jgi:hypothetical protein
MSQHLSVTDGFWSSLGFDFTPITTGFSKGWSTVRNTPADEEISTGFFRSSRGANIYRASVPRLCAPLAARIPDLAAPGTLALGLKVSGDIDSYLDGVSFAVAPVKTGTTAAPWVNVDQVVHCVGTDGVPMEIGQASE